MPEILLNSESLNENDIETIEMGDNSKLIFPKTNITSLNFGPHLVLSKIISQTGLLNILKDIFPLKWQEIITLAYFLVNINEPIMYCQDWVEKTKTFLDINNIYSQRISELLH
jgi:hypothetical protein